MTAPFVRIRRPELDEFNAGLLNCPETQCKGKASLDVVKGGYKCCLCSAYYEYLELDNRPNFVDHEDATSGDCGGGNGVSQAERLASAQQVAANRTFAARIEHLEQDHARRALTTRRNEEQQLSSALSDANTPATAKASLRRDLAEERRNIEQLQGKLWQDYCDRRIATAKHLLSRHFGDARSGRPLSEHLAARALAVFTDFVRRRSIQIHNVRCALSAAIVVASSQCGESQPFSESDIWRRLNVPTGVVASRSQCQSRRQCLPELNCDLTQSIRSYRKEMSELLPMQTAVPSRPEALRKLVQLYVFDVKPPLCSAYRQRVDAQLALTLKQMADDGDDNRGILERCCDATLASAVICSALHSFFVPLHGQTARVSAQWVTRLTRVSRGRIQTVSQALRRLPLVYSNGTVV